MLQANTQSPLTHVEKALHAYHYENEICNGERGAKAKYAKSFDLKSSAVTQLLQAADVYLTIQKEFGCVTWVQKLDEKYSHLVAIREAPKSYWGEFAKNINVRNLTVDRIRGICKDLQCLRNSQSTWLNERTVRRNVSSCSVMNRKLGLSRTCSLWVAERYRSTRRVPDNVKRRTA